MRFSQLEDYSWSRTPAAAPEGATPEFLSSHQTLDAFEVGGLKFVCPPGVYHPTEFSSTRFMYRGVFNELERFGPRVLELGTGCGAIGICLAAAGCDVTLVDIEPIAVECAVNNAQLNRIRVRALCADLFDGVPGEQFDSIVFNIPLLDKTVDRPIEVMACDPGGVLLTRFLAEAPHYLAPEGSVCVSVSNLGNREATFAALASYRYRILYSEYYGNEDIWNCLLLAQPKP